MIAVGRVVGRLHSVGTQTKLNMRANTCIIRSAASSTEHELHPSALRVSKVSFS